MKYKEYKDKKLIYKFDQTVILISNREKDK